MREPGTRSVSRILATAASLSSPSRKSRRAMSIGRRKGYWVHLAKVAYEKYFMRKVRKGQASRSMSASS